MRSKAPRTIRWTKHKKIEEFLDDPIAESLYGLFLNVKDSPRHLAFNAENLINEVFYLCNRFYEDDKPGCHLDEYVLEIENDMGWKYAVDLVLPMAYLVISYQKNIPSRINHLLSEIERNYRNTCYWNACQKLFAEHEDREAKRFYMGKDIHALIKNRKDIKKFFGDVPVFIINKIEQFNAVLGNNATIEK